MRIIGFDLGLRAVNPAAGFCLDWSEAPECIAIRLFCPNDKNLPDKYSRVDWLAPHFEQFIKECEPDALAYEVPFVGFDPQVAILFGHIGGIIRALGSQRNLPVIALAPTTIKMITTGSGAADKESMIVSIQQLLNIDLKCFESVILPGRKAKIDMASHVADAAGAAYTAGIQLTQKISNQLDD